MSYRDYVEHVQGLLTVIQYIESRPKVGRIWLCSCKCGKFVLFPSSYFCASSSVKSCGCLHKGGPKKPKGYKESKDKRYNKKPLINIGDVFGLLTVIADGGSKHSASGESRKMWECVCACGGSNIVSTFSLRSGETKSCGCLRKKWEGKGYPSIDVGSSVDKKVQKSPHLLLYGKWKSMIARCHNPNQSGYSDYGGRGINVVDEWKNDYRAFLEWSLANNWKQGTRIHLDRIDNDGPYAPWNCRYVDVSVNARNKRSNIYVEFEGKRYQILDLLDLVGSPVPGFTVSNRLKNGWSVAEAILLPKLSRWTRARNPEGLKQIVEERLNEFRLKQNQNGS